MSGNPPSEGGEKKQQVIEVKAVVENKEELERLKKEKEDLLKAKQDLETQLQKAKEDQTTSDERKQELEDQLAEISRKDFENDKAKLVELAKSSNLPEEKVKYVQDTIKTPEDLARTTGLITEFIEMFKKANEPPEIPENPEEDGTKQPPKGRATMTPPPQGGETFETAKEMVDSLYDRVAKGDREAERQLKKFWEKFVVSEKKNLSRISIAECLKCKSGIPTDAQECPFCGWKKSQGME